MSDGGGKAVAVPARLIFNFYFTFLNKKVARNVMPYFESDKILTGKRKAPAAIVGNELNGVVIHSPPPSTLSRLLVSNVIVSLLLYKVSYKLIRIRYFSSNLYIIYIFPYIQTRRIPL